MMVSGHQVAANVVAAKRQSVYLAGTLAPNGWRHLLVQGFSDKPCCTDEFPVLEGALFGQFDYAGPFPDRRIETHENKAEWEHHERTWKLRRAAINKADVVFGWIESNEAYATIAELAYAAGKGKLVRYALSAELGPLGPNGNKQLFPEVLRTFKMFDCGIDLYLSPRMAFARLFNLPQNSICNVSQRDAVYFIEDNIERIKIGFSNDPQKRLRELQTGSSNSLHLIGSIPGGKHLESKLHSNFAHLKLKNEWFHATQGLRGFIEMELGLRHPQVELGDVGIDDSGNRIIPTNYVPNPYKPT